MAFTYFSDLNRRLRAPGGPPYYFRVANLVVSALMIVSAVIFFVWADFMRIMLGIYEIVFGAWMIMFEVAEVGWLTPYVQFMFTWRGRGLFYVFIGCLTLGYKTLGWVFGSVITAIGVAYIVLSFTVKKHESYVNSAVEFVHLAALRMYAAFLFSFFGRGLLYVALGCVTLEGAGRKAELGIGLVIVAVGVVFVGVAVGSRVEFDDPEDEYAAVVRGMQQGCYGGEAAEKSVRTVDAYSGPQGRSGTLGALTSSSMASASAATDGRGFTSAHLPISNPL
ncbi:hypothetical protein GGI15_000590 [Coemansia interrupta]|uniref:COPI associated protein n=1 Tax=Coemansia interrupta TaxID=1126814 RepID=A0A9W8LND7_9FUNG|nr:hypothetical protein GGI15_000590 [Coemansia interrupta]